MAEWFAICAANFDADDDPGCLDVIWSSPKLLKWEAVKAANDYDCPPGFKVGIKPYHGSATLETLQQFRRDHGHAIWIGS